MKILMINKFAYLKGGSERLMFDLSKILTDNGHEVIYFSTHDKKNIACNQNEFFIPSWNMKSLRGIIQWFKNLYSFKTQNQLEKLIQQEKPDIVHIHNAYYHISPSIFSILRKYTLPVVMTVHDYHLISPNYMQYCNNTRCNHHEHRQYWKIFVNKCVDNSFIKSFFAMAEMYYRRFFKFYEKGVDSFIVTSDYMKNEMIEAGYDTDKIVKIHPGINSQYKSLKDPYNNKKPILFYGRFVKEKGIHTFIDAMKSLPDINAQIIGDGPLRDEISDKIKDLPSISLLPFIENQEELFSYVQNALCVVVPSVWPECYGLTVIESYSQKTPVIATRVGGMQELILESKTGFTFEVDNSHDLAVKIKELYTHPDKAHRFGENGYDFVNKQNDVSEYYKNILTVYKKIVS